MGKRPNGIGFGDRSVQLLRGLERWVCSVNSNKVDIDTFAEDLYNIVTTANQTVEKETKAFYGAGLAERGVPLLDASSASATAMPASGSVAPVTVEAWRKNMQDGMKGDGNKPVPATLAQAQAGL